MKKYLLFMLTMLNSLTAWSAMPSGYTFYTTTNGVSTAFTALPTAYRCAIGIAWNSTQRTSSSNPTEIGAGIPTDYQGSFVIPSFLKDQAYYVTEIGYKAFYKCNGITSISIPSSITYIDVNAFNGCTGLLNVSIPGSIGIIDDYAFICCHNLKTITLNEGTNTIGNYAFLACKSLSSIDIPASVTKIGSQAFGGAQIAHDGIGYGSYEGCDNLTKVIVHWDEPISISSGTFSNIANCTLYVPKGKVETYSNANVWKDFKTIKEYSPIIEFADATVKSICVSNWDTDGDGELSEDEAAAVTSLDKKFRKSKIKTFEELRFFTGLTSIYTEAFEDCSSLTTITIPENVKSINLQAFSRCFSLTNIVIPNNKVETIYGRAFWNCTALTLFDVPNGVKTIASTAFEGCSNLASISIPSSVTSIGGTPFNGCTKLTSIYVDSNNETYESPAGSNAIIEIATNNLVAGCNSTIIPESVISIGNNAFAGSSLSSLIIPDNVTSIGNSAFSGSTLASITGLKGIKTISEKSFYNCNRLHQIVLPANLTSIGVSAFEGCSALASINLPVSITSIGGLAFQNCTNLSSIVIPKSVTSVGGSVFYGCTGLESATIEGTTIGYQQFYGCKSLESIVLSNNVNSIGNNAFIGCTSLTSVNIPLSVSSIGSAAFDNCDNLILVVSENKNPTNINDAAFYGISSNARLQVPEGTKSKYQAITGWSQYFKEIVDDGNTPEVLTLTIQVDGLGTVNYDGVSLRNKVSTFYILERNSATLSFNAENANGLKSVKVNNVDVTSNIANNQYTTNAITSNSIIEVKFDYPEFTNGQTFGESYSYGSITYRVISVNDKTCEVYSAYSDEDDGDFIIPASIYGYRVIGIYNYAFSDEDDMESITIPPSITYIGSGAFDDGGTVSDVYISDLEAWCNISFADSYSAPTRGNLYLNGSKIIELIIPDNVTTINNYAFYGCSCVQSATIHDGVSAIGTGAFSGCSLSNVTVMAATPIAIDATAFPNRNNATLYVRKGCKAVYEAANYWKEFKEIVEIDARSEQTLTMTEVPAMTYGDAAYLLPQKTAEGLTLTWSVDNDAVASISGNTLTVVGAGTATVTATQTGNDNYKPFSREFVLTVKKATLTIAADDKTKEEGEENPDLTVSYDGFVNGDDYSVLTIQPTINTPAKKDSPVGDYPITVSGAEADNYEITYVEGTLTISEKIIETQKCATPTIAFVNGELTFGCETEGVEYVYEITSTDVKKGNASKVKIDGKLKVSVYVTKEGYEDSDVATKDIELSAGAVGDVNGDGVIDVSDYIGVANIILNGKIHGE